ncbi:hypothetical protein RB2501_11387 [Robiginitalea biformata HTCC2501]|uniref:Uncharacterized protein n=1 Tax=Robiginitalea biformata (strain ATCC BAA-864 / DSM 15991 / KCTC 12146 / HTCC2501) TaxID=313596 RepID=A4CMN4_ROBBH|nr:hypothetical protein RB2501_11387 [Robiginitalea biformata HTCC2501]
MPFRRVGIHGFRIYEIPEFRVI